MAVNKNKVQLQTTVLDSNGHPLSSTDVNPLTSSDCVIMENGMTLEDIMGNDTISTPTIMNEDTSFRIGVGDSEAKVVDSDVAKMVFEGKSYQNILPKPTTLIMNTDEKEFKINDKIDSSIVLDDNVAEIATVKGQTYANVVQEESASEYVAIDEELSGQSITTTGKPEGYIKNAILEGSTKYHDIDNDTVLDEFDGTKNLELISVNNPKMYATGKNLFDGILAQGYIGDSSGLANTSMVGVHSPNYMKVKPNTTYTRTITGNRPSDFTGRVYFYDINKTYINSYIDGAIFTTPENAQYMRFRYYIGGQNITPDDFSESNIQIEESSTATPYEPYKGVTIEQDIDSIPLTSDMFEQQNLDGNNVIKGMSYQQVPRLSNNTRISSKTIVKVKPNTTYTLQSENIQMWCMTFDKNGGYIKNTDLGNTITTDANTHFLGIKLQYSDNSDITPSSLDSLNLTLQEVTDEIVLRSIGDVKDTLNLTTGEYVQRVQQVVLDGSEAWVQSYGNSNPIMTVWLDIPNKTGGAHGRTVCDKLSTGKEIYSSDTNLGICFVKDTNELYKNIRIRTQQILDGQTVNSFKSWLQQNPITVQYQLETPIIKKVNLTNTTKLPSYTSTTHYDTIVPSNSLIPNIKLPSTIDYNVAIKPSTQYTIRANTQDALTVDLGGTTGTLSNGKVTLTTPTTLAHNEVKFSGTGKVKEVMVIEGNEIKNNVPFFNGMKNVQMGGIKLVNLIRNISTYNGFITISADKRTITYTDTGYYGNVNFDSSLLKPNTLYTLYFKITQNTSTINMPCGIDIDGNAINPIVDNGGTGIFKIAFTSLDKLAQETRFVFRHSTNDSVIKVQDLMLFEGDWTHLDEIPFIESEMIIEQPIIKSQGKNLFNIPNQTLGTSYGVTVKSINGKINILGTPSNNYGYVDVPNFVQPNKTYTYSVYEDDVLNTNYRLWIRHDDGGVLINPISGGTFTTRNTAISRVQFIFENLESGTPINKNVTIQIEEGSSATTYEPFKQHTLSSNRVIGYEENCYYANGGGFKLTNTGVNSMLADVEGLSIAYVVGGSSNFTFWDKDDVFISGKAFLDTALSSYDKNGFIQVPSNAKYMRFASGNETTSNTYKTATVTGELPLRSLPNGVCDSFNLVTGEYVQRVGEIVLDGINIKPRWIVQPASNNITSYFDFEKVFVGAKTKSYAFSDKFIYEDYLYDDDRTRYNEGIRIGNEGWGSVRIFNSRLETADYNGFVKWLQQNPITVQYELETPIVRKIGLTAKGVFAEASLGDCEWGASPTTANNTFTTRYRTKSASSLPIVYNTHLFTDDFDVRHFNIEAHGDYEYVSNMEYGQYVNVRRERLESDTLEAFNKWLAQNPIKVGYITWKQTSSSYSNIQKPIFFNDIKVEFMYDNVDIQPSLTYQARTLNSYVMDMMKANTRYTLKALANPNPFAIDGTSYSATTNGTFTSPSTLTNKLLITGQDVQELMIIEGDVTGKTIPYYKGIRSAYNDVDRVEIHSANKNLLPKEFHNRCFGEATQQIARICSKMIECKPNTVYTVYNIPSDFYTDVYVEYANDYAEFDREVITTKRVEIASYGRRSKITFTTPIGYKYMAIYIFSGSGFTQDGYNYTNAKISLCLGTLDDYTYQPHKENTTIINMPTQLETVEVVRPVLEKGSVLKSGGTLVEDDTMRRPKDFIPVQPNINLTFMNGNANRAENVIFYDIDKNYIGWLYTDGSGDLVVPDNCYFIKFYSGNTNTNDLVLIKKQDKPIALNELPNGVKDELIINRATSSAKLIRRVGKVVLDGFSSGHDETVAEFNFRKFVIYTGLTSIKVAGQCVTSNNLPCIVNGEVRNTIRLAVDGKIVINIDGFSSINEYFNYLKQNPLTVYYELAEPVITEIRLKGYPFVYEDGSISLNTDIAPVTRTSYNVNQHQLINSQNETIIRHDKQTSDLYDYIEIYLDEIYRMELFKMQLELSL